MEEYRKEAIISSINYLKTVHDFEFVTEVGCGAFGKISELNHHDKNETIAAKIVLEEFVSCSEKEIWPLISHENLLPLINVE